MKRLSGGIDIGKDSHHMIILDDQEQVLYQKRIPHHLKEMELIQGTVVCLTTPYRHYKLSGGN